MRLFLEPEDVWLFRDGRPFSAGSDHHARSLFPPLPGAVQGMIRSYHLLRVVKGVDLTNRVEVQAAVGGPTSFPPGFRLRGPVVAREEGEPRRLWRYYPLPADALGSKGTFAPLRLSELPAGVLTSCPIPAPIGPDGQPRTPQMLLPRGEPEKPEGEWWLREDELLKYLNGGAVTAVGGRDLYEHELRFGIEHDPARRTTRQHMLYQVEYIRPRDRVGLWLEVEWRAGDVDRLAGWPTRGMLRAGGEGRAARFRQVPTEPLPAPARPLPERFKLYLATPTFFARGWQPADWDAFFEGPPPALVAAALGRYQALGGFDLTRRGAAAHKPARRYVPAGSVYFFESRGEACLRGDSLCDADEGEGGPAPIGWGQALVGRW